VVPPQPLWPRDNKCRPASEILVKAERRRFIDQVEAEYQAIVRWTVPHHHHPTGPGVPRLFRPARIARQLMPTVAEAERAVRVLAQNVAPHRTGLRFDACTALGHFGDATADQLDSSHPGGTVAY
jgi:hypothetical protein